MTFPELKFNLPDWMPSDFNRIQVSTKQVKHLARTAGESSDKFVDACDRLWFLAKSSKKQNIAEHINSPLMVRALAHMWISKEGFCQKVQLDAELVAALEAVSDRLTRLSVLHLIRAYFSLYDDLGEWESLSTLEQLIKRALSRFAGQGYSSEIARLAEHRVELFSENGPVNLVQFSIDNDIDLAVVINRWGLRNYSETRFAKVCRYRYYIETLKTVSPEDKNPVFKEVSLPEVYQSPGNPGMLLGHEIMKVLIDRASEQGIPEHWQETILIIAGDPRVPRTSKNYQKWWEVLGESYVAKVRGWLSRFDLNLFLEIIEEYGRSTNDSDLKRMFPGRKRFLGGLIENGVVVESRLFISRGADFYLRRNYSKEELPNYALVKDTDKSLIYLRVGHCHLVEGSHTCKLWIFPRLPAESNITNYSKEQFSYRELTSKLLDLYLSEAGESTQYESIVHRNSDRFIWENRAIEFLKDQGVSLDIELLFSKADYQRYKRMYGV